jgi:hypothetical protein
MTGPGMAQSAAFGSNAPIAVSTDSELDTEWSPELDPEDLVELREAEQDPSKIIAKLPKESARLGYYSTLCLMSNRLIGELKTSKRETGFLTGCV